MPPESLDEYLKRELNDWQVDMYTKNPNLFIIPKSIIEVQKDFLKKKYYENKNINQPLHMFHDDAKKLAYSFDNNTENHCQKYFLYYLWGGFGASVCAVLLFS